MSKDLKAECTEQLYSPLTNKTITNDCSKKCFVGSVSSNEIFVIKRLERKLKTVTAGRILVTVEIQTAI
jgi:hypothetical protein